MTTRFAFASLAATLLTLGAPAYGQELLLRYTFDDPLNLGADSASNPAPGALKGTGTGAGYSTNTPNGLGGSFDTGTGNNFLETNGDVAKLDGLQKFTLTLWVNLSEVIVNERFMSDGGAPGGSGIGGFDLLVTPPTSGSISAGNFGLGLALDGTTANATVPFSALNQWVFIAVTYDGSLGSSNVTFYSGSTSSAVAQMGSVVSSSAGTIDDNTLPFRVGGSAQAPAGGDRTPAGYFDDVRVYSGAADQAFLENVRLANVPEPSSAALLLCGIAGAGLRRWRRAGAAVTA